MLPRVVLHNGVSVDGRMDGYSGDLGLYYGLAARWKADAMLSGSNTILAAFAQIEQGTAAASEPAPDPGSQDGMSADAESGADQETQVGTGDFGLELLVVVDSRGRIHNWRAIQRQPYWGDVVVLCSQATPSDYLDSLEAEGVDYIQTAGERVDLRAALETLNERYAVKLVRVDSGGILNGALLRAGLVDEVSVLISPGLAGGQSPSSIFQAADIASPQEVIPLHLIHCERLEGDHVWLKYEVIKA